MDGICGASSVIAIISLAIQLGDSIKKLSDFWQSMKGAPREIKLIISDLSVLASLVDVIQHEAESSKPHTQCSIPVSCQYFGNVRRHFI